MPVVTVTAPPPADARLLRAIADAIADALGLGPGDVLATLVPSTVTVASGAGESDPWPVIAIHGSDRGAEQTAAARAAADGAFRAWAVEAGARLGGVWTEWLLPAP